MEKKDYLMEDNSILLLMDSDNEYNFKQALYKRNGVVGSVEKLEEPCSIIAEDIDIRYFNRVHDDKLTFFWIDIPDEMTLKLNSAHIEYVLDCMKKNTTKVKNIKKYLLAALFNASTTMGSYYQAEVNHDFPQYAVAR